MERSIEDDIAINEAIREAESELNTATTKPVETKVSYEFIVRHTSEYFIIHCYHSFIVAIFTL